MRAKRSSPVARQGSGEPTAVSGRLSGPVLVCNAGSSSLRMGLFDAENEAQLATAHVDLSARATRLTLHRTGHPDLEEEPVLHGHAEAFARVLELLRSGPAAALSPGAAVGAVGHRVVHGGDRCSGTLRITEQVVQQIRDWSPRAPLHHPASLACIAEAERRLPGVPQFAAFDTAFHATLPEAARTYAIPRRWTREWGLRRYGFHGLSHSWCAGRAAEMLGRGGERLVIAHLGAGASLSAVRDGVCIDTSMGFTPLEGLMMGSRSGSVDPGLLLHLLRERGLDAERLDQILNHESGLLGVSGLSADMRAVLEAEPRDADARLAVEIYVHRLRREIGAMAATLGGLDALVFTAGVGENSADIRRRACEGLDHLGLRLDPEANAGRRPDADVARLDSPARILIVASREDLCIVRDLLKLVRT
jgi:acetate kinase